MALGGERLCAHARHDRDIEVEYGAGARTRASIFGGYVELDVSSDQGTQPTTEKRPLSVKRALPSGWQFGLLAVIALSAGALCFAAVRSAVRSGTAPQHAADARRGARASADAIGASPLAGGPGQAGDQVNLIRFGVAKVDTEVQRKRLDGNLEWVVAPEFRNQPVQVRTERSESSPVLQEKPADAVLVGSPADDWLALAKEPGFVRFANGDRTLLRPRHASYVRLTDGGQCIDFGYFPITDVDVCEAAADALALANRQLQVRALGQNAPEGCHLDATGGLRLNSDKGVPSEGSWKELNVQAICSTEAYAAADTKPALPTTNAGPLVTEGAIPATPMTAAATTAIATAIAATTTSTSTGAPLPPTTTLYTTTRAMAEWEAQASVNVRAGPSLNAEILKQMPEGSIFFGWPEGSWLRLAGQPGYVKIIFTEEPLLFPRHVVYALVSEGTCAEEDRYAIRNPLECQAAAQALSLPGSEPRHWEGQKPAPEGCFLDEKDGKETLWIALDERFKGAGAVGQRRPICTSRPQPQLATFPPSTTTTTTVKKGNPSLLCFAVLRLNTPEEDLIKLQLRNSIGIFACDETIAMAAKKVYLGKDRDYRDFMTMDIPSPDATMGDLSQPGVTTNSWLNTQVFISALHKITYDVNERVWQNDWLIKADPDAVLFPDRLRHHLLPHTGSAQYIVNCNFGGVKLFGAVEAYTKQAIGRYKDNFQKCNRMPWHGWGEDSFMQNCMDSLGVPAVQDFKVVGDARCTYAPCSDTGRAAYHPFKDVQGWLGCYKESTTSTED